MNVRGVDLAVRDDGRGRALVWAHGLLGSMAADDEGGVLRPSPSDGVRVIRYDARGHGRSGATRRDVDYQWPALGRDMVGVLDGAGVERAVLAGASMGCATALHAAVAAPERVEGLVLVIPPTAWATRPRQAVVYRLGSRLVRVLGMRPFAVMARGAPAPVAEVHAAALRSLGRMDRRVVSHILRGAAASDLPDPDSLRAVDVPALILAWAGDPGHPTSTAERLAEVLPNATLKVASGAVEIRRWPDLISEAAAS